ncbi:MAG: hypothetical protein K0R90_148 [Oscillospiraceae bacterium]|jgi:methylenetetrahydrofolate reductase (NADPH)|nr:hypothetical protein [Oscillospiraceae bacterium]
MKLNQLYDHKKAVFSFEVFPPKKNGSIETIYDTLEELKGLSPDFISVTYGAGGNLADNSTCEIASIIKDRYHIEPVAHLTCVNSSRQEVLIMLDRLKDAGIENIMALRGDKNPDIEPKHDFLYASDLVQVIREKGDFNIMGACYPEGHPESDNLDQDVKNLKTKVDAGVTGLVSQLFFDNNDFYHFVDSARDAGITVPISAGIMPVVNKRQILRIISLCGASLPKKFVKMINKYEFDEEALRDAGIAYATEQIVDLFSNSVQGVHLYTMNNPYLAKKISSSISSILKFANK